MLPITENEPTRPLPHSMTRNDRFRNAMKEECSLERNQSAQDGMIGRLPAAAHLANPFVPFQVDEPP